MTTAATPSTSIASNRDRHYRIAIIGCGARAETFARQLHNQHPRGTLAGICDIDQDRAARFAEYCGLGDTPRHSRIEDLLAAPGLDAVIVTTPEFTHADVTLAALAAGKHVYLEKPLAHTVEDCHRLMRGARNAGPIVYVGFNLRANPAYSILREIIHNGTLGKILHISGLEQLQGAHGAAFMRRWHRRASRSGGLMNTKCCHDLDIIQWLIGHEHKITRLASFGGNNVFNAKPAPATHCSVCPAHVKRNCQYVDRAGFVFPVTGKLPIHKTQQTEIYGNDMCVFSADKDIVDNQTTILEWDHGVRGSFNLQLFQDQGLRETRVWGEKGHAVYRSDSTTVEVTNSSTGDRVTHTIAKRTGGHGGTDTQMIDRFIATIEGTGEFDSGLSHGLAATLIAIKSDESRLTGQVVSIDPSEYAC